MRNESKIFHRHLPSLVCMFGFLGFITVGVIKLYFFHYWKFHFKGDRSSYRFLYHFGKALNHAACAGAFNGRNDETISNKTGRTYKEHGENSPLWVFAIKWLTDVLDPAEEGRPCHILDSIEPLRPDLDEEKNEMTKDEQKAELRRCAMYEARPFSAISIDAMWPVYFKFVGDGELLSDLSADDQRTLFLLFAEAL